MNVHFMQREEVGESGVEIWQCKDCTRRIAFVPPDETIVYDEGDSVEHWLDFSGLRQGSTMVKK